MGAPVAGRGAGGAEPPHDALTYVRAVKSRFQATKPEVYEAFLEVMRDFKNARCVVFFAFLHRCCSLGVRFSLPGRR